MSKTYISAGAGSGKTYRITTEVARLINDKELRPEQVIMTTFTKAAAQELREKAKQELAKIGLAEDAQRMEHALIGTVHSVANTFISKYWYVLGIMPDASPLEEEEQKEYRNQSIKELIKGKDEKEIQTFFYEFAKKHNILYNRNEHKSGIDYGFWVNDLVHVLDYMQWYGITGLDDSLELTNSLIDILQPKKDANIQCLAQDAISNTQEAIDNLQRKTQKAKDQRQQLESFRRKDLTDEELKELEAIVEDRCKDTDEGQAFLIAQTEQAIFTEESVKDLRLYAEYIFQLATKWQGIYRRYKDQNHLIDFNDMEEMFLKLLENQEVQEDIRSNYTHLFVDEFQDSNPIQVKIFERLSTIMQHTVYVGDKKQAIYGFRGADTELTRAVSESMDCSNLPHSYRSVEPLVNFSNNIFQTIFQGMQPAEICLTMPEDKTHGNRDQVDTPLRLWNTKSLAQQIQQLILREHISPKDIAVLARNNEDLDTLVTELQKLQVPVCRETSDIQDSRTGRLLKALLTLVAMPGNQLARAEIAYLTEQEYGVDKVIEERLQNLEQEDGPATYLMDKSIVGRLFQLMRYKVDQGQPYTQNLLGYQSISALVESLIIELDLYALVQSWDNAAAEETNLQEFINLARKYEENATKLARPATVTGFLDYFTNRKQSGGIDEDGVCLTTYHASKGLEWKVVILLSLDKDATADTEIATKEMLNCHYHHSQAPSRENLYPPKLISLVRNIYPNSNLAKSALVSRLQKHDKWNTVRERAKREAARLLYVGVTRARNILILAAKGKNGAVDLNWFRSVGQDNLQTTLPETQELDIFNNGMPFRIEQLDPENLLEWPAQKSDTVHHIIREAPSPINNPLHLTPSNAGKAPHDIVVINDRSFRMDITNKPEEEARMGDFIHQVFCCCDDGIDSRRITTLRDSYGFTDRNLSHPEQLLDSWNYLVQSLEDKYGKSVIRHHEKPFRHFDHLGHLVNGYMDLVWETADGYVIVDYKTCPGDYKMVFTATSEHYVGRYGAQLDCYESALRAIGGKPVLARVIYYPVTRYLVAVR